MTIPKEAVTAATKAMEAHVKANSVPVPDAFGTGVSHAFNPSMEACLEVALTAAIPHLPHYVGVLPPRPGCVDPEDYARIHNAGFEAAMAHVLAPAFVEEPEDWLEDRLNIARAEALRDAAAELPYLDRPKNMLVRQQNAAHWLIERANTIHPEQKDTTND